MQRLGGRNRYNVFLGKEYSQVDADGATEFLHHFSRGVFGSSWRQDSCWHRKTPG